MKTTTIDQGKEYIVKRVKEEAAKKDLQIKNYAWKTMASGTFQLKVHSANRIADREFTEEQLIYCQTRNQQRINTENKVLSIILQLEK